MLFDQFPNTVPEQYRDAAREWLTNEFNQSILTGSEVCAYCGITQSKLSRIVATENPFFVFKKGNVFLFIAHYAYPWMEDVKAQQAASVAARQSKTEKKKVGRPKKVKGQYTYMLWGQEYTDTRPPAEVEREWKQKVASYYPHVFADLEKPMALPDAMAHPDNYPDFVNHVMPLFAEIGALFRKLAAGQLS